MYCSNMISFLSGPLTVSEIRISAACNEDFVVATCIKCNCKYVGGIQVWQMADSLLCVCRLNLNEGGKVDSTLYVICYLY